MVKKGRKTSFPRWLKEQRERQIKPLIFIWRTFFLLLILFTLAWFGWQIWSQLKKSLWKGKNNFNFVVAAQNDLLVFSYQQERAVNVLHVPGQTYVELSKGLGEYPASSIWSLGELEEIGGGPLLKMSTQNFLGVPIQGWGRVETKLKIKNEKLKINKRELLELIVRLAFSRERNLTLWDLARLAYQVNGLQSSQIHFSSLSQTRAGEEIVLPDGSGAFRIRREFLDSLSRDLFKNNVVLEEGIIWAVINTTAYSGLSAQAARIINNIGGEVVVVSHVGLKDLVKEGIYCWEEKICQSYTARLLAETFELPLENKKLPESRAEGVLVLGEEYWKHFYSL